MGLKTPSTWMVGLAVPSTDKAGHDLDGGFRDVVDLNDKSNGFLDQMMMLVSLNLEN
jgi:hypothetical protein